MEPLLSVLILTYNQEEYIAQAIEGAVGQQCSFPFEVVVADDHSTDGTLEVCNTYRRRYPDIVRVIANESNKGLLDNYYDTLLQCRGKYVADCAGDDFWTDCGKLQRQFDILESHPGVSLTYTNYARYLQESGTFVHNCQQSRPSEQDGVRSYREHIYDLLDQHGRPFIFVGSSCFRMDAFLGMYRRYTDFFRNKAYTCEDFQLAFFLFRSGDFYYENRETVAYRILPGSASRQTDLERTFRYTYGVFCLRMEIIDRFGYDVSRCRGFVTAYLTGLLSMANRLGQREERAHLVRLCRRAGYRPSFRVRCHLLVGRSRLLSALFRRLA